MIRQNFICQGKELSIANVIIGAATAIGLGVISGVIANFLSAMVGK